MAITSDPELPILLQALSEPLGLVIAVEDFTKARGRLVYVVTKQQEPLKSRLAALSFRRSPYNPERELWIVSSRAVGPSASGNEAVGLESSRVPPDSIE